MSKKDYMLLRAYQATGLTPEEVERVKRERDCLVGIVNERRSPCDACKNMGSPYCCPGMKCDWQWRGVKDVSSLDTREEP